MPQPGFASVGNFSLTFYANIGTAYNNVTSAGTTGGPAKIVAQEVDANGNLVTPSSTCTTTTPCSFQVTQYLPIITAGVSSCPGVGVGPTCQYPPNPSKLLTNVLSVVNNPNPNYPNPQTPLGIQPVFSYNVFDTTTQAGATSRQPACRPGSPAPPPVRASPWPRRARLTPSRASESS